MGGFDSMVAAALEAGVALDAEGFTNAAISGGSAGEGFRVGVVPINVLLSWPLGSGTPKEPPAEVDLRAGLMGFGVIMAGSVPRVDAGLIFLDAAGTVVAIPGFLMSGRAGVGAPGAAGLRSGFPNGAGLTDGPGLADVRVLIDAVLTVCVPIDRTFLWVAVAHDT